jgi:hypothetical protein
MTTLEGEEAQPQTLEVRILEAFIAQHYLGIAVPTSLITSEQVDKKLIKAVSLQSGVKVSAVHNPSYATEAESPRGVPISALVFGGRRRELAPLVYQARDWAHGVLVGASVASETTAAATGAVGVVRRLRFLRRPRLRRHQFAQHVRQNPAVLQVFDLNR